METAMETVIPTATPDAAEAEAATEDDENPPPSRQTAPETKADKQEKPPTVPTETTETETGTARGDHQAGTGEAPATGTRRVKCC